MIINHCNIRESNESNMIFFVNKRNTALMRLKIKTTHNMVGAIVNCLQTSPLASSDTVGRPDSFGRARPADAQLSFRYCFRNVPNIPYDSKNKYALIASDLDSPNSGILHYILIVIKKIS